MTGLVATKIGYVEVSRHKLGSRDQQRLDHIDMQARLFEHFPPDGLLRLLSAIHPATGQPPGKLRVKDVLHDQQLTIIVEERANDTYSNPRLPDTESHLGHADCPGRFSK